MRSDSSGSLPKPLSGSRLTISGLRWWILALLTASIAINFIDRQTFSVLAPVLRQEFGFTNTHYSIMVFCFLLGMGLMQIPIGILLDRIGPRRTFTLIVLGWSFTNAAHALGRTVWQFSALRLLLGNFECGNYSGGMKVISQWFPTRERALAGGIFNAGTLIGPVVAPPLVVWLTLQFNWKFAFVVPSSLGLVWLILWLRLFYEPRRHPRIASDELALIEGDSAGVAPSRPAPQTPPPVSLRMLLRYRQTWGVILIRAFSGPFSHFYWYWLPSYLDDRGLSFELIGLLAWIPYMGGGVGNVFGGWLAGRLLRRGVSIDRTRKTCFVLGGALAASSALIPFVPYDGVAIALIWLSIFGSNIIEANYIGVVTDVFPGPVVGRLTGLTGVGDNIMSMTLMLVTGIVVDRFSYLPVFIAVGAIPVAEILALFWGVGRVERLSFAEN